MHQPDTLKGIIQFCKSEGQPHESLTEAVYLLDLYLANDENPLYDKMARSLLEADDA